MKKQTPQQFIETATQSQVECRVLRHAWDINKGTVLRESGRLRWTMPCMRECGTTKTMVITRRGKFERAYYKWVEGYHVTGGLRKEHLAELRLALFHELGL